MICLIYIVCTVLHIEVSTVVCGSVCSEAYGGVNGVNTVVLILVCTVVSTVGRVGKQFAATFIKNLKTHIPFIFWER